MESSVDEFIRTLHEEKLNTMKEREKYARDKILFVLGIMGFGSLNFGVSGFKSSEILFIVPLVAIGYDLYINAYDEGIKRIGAFLRRPNSCSSKCEKDYEIYVAGKRGKYAPIANVLFSLIGTIGALFIVFLSTGPVIQLWWFVILGIIVIVMYISHRRHIMTFDFENSVTSSNSMEKEA